MILLDEGNLKAVMDSRGIRIIEDPDDEAIVVFRSDYAHLPLISYERIKKQGFFKSDEHIFHFGDIQYVTKYSEDAKKLRLMLSLAVLYRHGVPRAIELLGSDGEENDVCDLLYDELEDDEFAEIEEQAYNYQQEAQQYDEYAAPASGYGAPAGAYGAPAGPAAYGAPSPAVPPMPQAAPLSVYVFVNEQQQGPYDEAHFSRLIRYGVVTPATLVWCEGMPDWEPAGTSACVGYLFGSVPPGAQGY